MQHCGPDYLFSAIAAQTIVIRDIHSGMMEGNYSSYPKSSNCLPVGNRTGNSGLPWLGELVGILPAVVIGWHLTVPRWDQKRSKSAAAEAQMFIQCPLSNQCTDATGPTEKNGRNHLCVWTRKSRERYVSGRGCAALGNRLPETWGDYKMKTGVFCFVSFSKPAQESRDENWKENYPGA